MRIKDIEFGSFFIGLLCGGIFGVFISVIVWTLKN